MKLMFFSRCMLSYFVLSPTTHAEDFKEILKNCRGAVVHLLVQTNPTTSSIGTGFIISDRRTAITNAHVVAGAKKVTARFADGTMVDCRLLGADKVHDIAALWLEKEAPESAGRPLQISISEPEALDPILTIGSPASLSQTPLTGHFSGWRNSIDVIDADTKKRVYPDDFKMLQLQIPGAGGSSGSPVIDRDGKVLGVVSSGIDKGKHGILFALPAELAGNFTDRKPVSFAGGAGIPTPREGLSNSKLSYKPDVSTVVKLEDDAATTVSLRSDNLGRIDPNWVGNYVADSQAFSSLVTAQQYQQLAAQNILTHVLNTPFRFSIVIPAQYRVIEKFDDTTEVFRMTVMSPPPENFTVEITARRIPTPTQNTIAASLNNHAQTFLNNELGLTVAQNPRQLQDSKFRMAGGDVGIKFGNRPLNVRVMRFYPNPNHNISDLVIYEIHRDILYTFRLPFNISAAGGHNVPPHIVERAFIAATFSSLP